MSFEHVRILLIDNYDSFTYNLVQAFRTQGAEVLIYRNDKIDVTAALELEPTHLVISPGPGQPRDAGNSVDMIGAFVGRTPILGVCLGHQCLIAHFGGEIVRAERLMHGKTSLLEHDGRTVFEGLPAAMEVGRYHSLIATAKSLPAVLEISAQTKRNEIMGVRHRELPLEGVQFHPESVLTPDGDALMENFMRMTST
jgi:anthranilate synthase/aminodeoxychorismate synthase-like glutamine amidotransferase